MHERTPIERELKELATALSEKYNGAPAIIILGGGPGIKRTMLASSYASNGRLRDLLGILEAAKQIESLKHFKIIEVPKEPGQGTPPQS